jgi:hypothetical protein
LGGTELALHGRSNCRHIFGADLKQAEAHLVAPVGFTPSESRLAKPENWRKLAAKSGRKENDKYCDS